MAPPPAAVRTPAGETARVAHDERGKCTNYRRIHCVYMLNFRHGRRGLLECKL